MIDLKESDILKNWKYNDILLSINTMTYNHEKYIAQCIEGILMQKTNFAFELLIHDDASTNNTAAIIKEYEKKYPNIIKPIYQTENKWSKGIKISATYQYPRAKGKYIAVCEGDDYWIDENKLQMQVDFLENNPEYGMCYTKARQYNQKEMFFYKKSFGSGFVALFASVGINPLLVAAILPCICGVMYGITPPLALGMYAGISIAESDFGKTVRNGMWWGVTQYLLEVIVLLGLLPILGL